MVKRFHAISGQGIPLDPSTGIPNFTVVECVEASDFDALAERCERLEEALRVVMQPYGMYDKAVHNTFGHGQDQILEAGRNIRDLLYGRNGDKE